MPGIGRTAVAVLAMLLSVKATTTESVNEIDSTLNQQMTSLVTGTVIDAPGQVVGPPIFVVNAKFIIAILEPRPGGFRGSRY